MSPSIEPEHDGSVEKSAPDDDKGSETMKNDDLEKFQTTKEGEILTQNAEAAKRNWIRTAPESPRNWPLWQKCWIIGGLIFYTIIVFICNTGFVTDDAEDNFGVNTESSVLGQSMVSTFPPSLHRLRNFQPVPARHSLSKWAAAKSRLDHHPSTLDWIRSIS